MLRRLIILSVFLTSCFNSFSQSKGIVTLKQDYSMQVWNNDHGLPSNNIRSLFQDSKGYFWIATFNGLVRFDGHTFEVYTSDDYPTLETNNIAGIIEDLEGRIYVGTQSSGVFHFTGTSFVKLKSESSYSEVITSLMVDSKNQLWIGTRGTGLFIYDHDSNLLIKHDDDNINSTTIYSVFEQDDGSYLLGTDKKGLLVYQNKSITSYPIPVPDSLEIRDIDLFKNMLCIGTEDGVYQLKDDKWLLLNGTQGFFVNEIKHDNENLYVASETGFIRVSTTGDFEFLEESDGLPSRQVSGIVVDNENNIWISTKRNGIALFKESKFFNVSEIDGLSSNFVNTVYQLSDGRVLVGNDNGGIDILADKSIKRLLIRTPLENISIKDIIQDSEGNLWIATYKGVLKIEEDKETLFSTNTGLPSNNTRCLLEDKSGNIWVGAKDNGLVKIHKDNSFRIYSKENGMNDNYVLCIEQLPNDDIIVGTYLGGLNIITKNDSIYNIPLGAEGKSPLVFNIEVIGQEEFWIATNIGLIYYLNGKKYLLGKKEGIFTEAVFDVYLDMSGSLWLTSNIGIIRVEQRSILDYTNGVVSKVNARIYNENDGMLSQECTGATKFIVARSQNLWVPTVKGLSVLSISNLKVNNSVPPVFIRSVFVDDEKVDFSNGITLEPNNRKLQIKYTAINYSSPKKINIKHRLVGYEDNWNEVGNNFEVTYMNLPDDEYQFEVIASNSDGLWNEEPATLSISVKPYFYESSPFYLLVISLTIFMAYSIYWIRVRVIVKKNKELQKLNAELDSFVYSVSHDLRAPLSSILGLLNVYKIDNDETNRLDYIEKVETSVHKLDDFIHEIIDHSRNVRLELKIEEIDVLELTNEVLEGLSYMNSERNIEVNINSNGIALIKSDRTRLKIILNNIVSNAFKYSRPQINNSFINISFEATTKHIIIRISDNGVGIKSDRLSKIFDMFYRASEEQTGSGLGLYIAFESAEKLNGKIEVLSELNQGTTFIVTIPKL